MMAGSLHTAFSFTTVDAVNLIRNKLGGFNQLLGQAQLHQRVEEGFLNQLLTNSDERYFQEFENQLLVQVLQLEDSQGFMHSVLNSFSSKLRMVLSH